MSEAYEYGEDDPDDEILDEEDRIRMEILEAEANEVWQEEPGDEEDEAKLAQNPLFALLSGFGGLRNGGMGMTDKENGTGNEDPEK